MVFIFLGDALYQIEGGDADSAGIEPENLGEDKAVGSGLQHHAVNSVWEMPGVEIGVVVGHEKSLRVQGWRRCHEIAGAEEHMIEMEDMTVREGDTAGMVIGEVEVRSVKGEEKELAGVEGKTDAEDSMVGVQANKSVVEEPPLVV